MNIKDCEFCGEKFNTPSKIKRYCSMSCQRKKNYKKLSVIERVREYNQKYRKNPENKEKYEVLRAKYSQKPEVKERNRLLAVTKYRERRREYWKDYGKRLEIRTRINEKDRNRRRIDKKYAIIDRLRRSLNHALTKYSKTGKIMDSKKYGIEWEKVIKGLEPFPEDIKKFEIDHKIPLHIFNLEKIEEVKKAFDPSNLQWLTMEDNRKKGGKIIYNNDIKSLGGNIKFLISA